MTEKACNRCGSTKPLSEFHPHKQTRDGFLNQCKECVRRKNNENYLREKERAKERAKTWYAENKERAGATVKRWRKANPERMAAIEQAYAKTRAQKKREELAKYPERRKAAKRRHREVNREKALAGEAVRRAVYEGRLVKPEYCEDCGEHFEAKALQGHHEDYAERLGVDWLCQQCHSARHKTRLFVESRAKVKADA